MYCPGEKSKTHSSTFPVIVFSTIHEDLQILFIVDLINCLTFRHPIDDPLRIENKPDTERQQGKVEKKMNIEEKVIKCLEFGFAHPCFIPSLGCCTLPVQGLLLCFRVFLENPSFITSNGILEEAWIIFNVFHGFSTNFHLMFFCSEVRKSFGTNLQTHFSDAKISMYRGF